MTFTFGAVSQGIGLLITGIEVPPRNAGDSIEVIVITPDAPATATMHNASNGADYVTRINVAGIVKVMTKAVTQTSATSSTVSVDLTASVPYTIFVQVVSEGAANPPEPSTAYDLIATALSLVDDSVAAGGAVRPSVTVKNQGTAAVPAGYVLGVLFSVNGTGTVWSDNYSSGLAAGASKVLPANGGGTAGTFPRPAGSFTLEAWVDDQHRLTAEADTTNNKKTVTVAAAPTGGGGTTPPATSPTRLLTQFHDTSIVDRMETYTGLRFEGSTLFNDSGSLSWGDIAAPWFATTETGKPRAWRTVNPTLRNTFCVTQAPFPAGQVAQLLNGSHQSDVDASLTAIVNSFGPAAIIRLGHEMNSFGQQFHWGYSQVAPADYISAFRYWHARSVALGFTQLRFDVCYLMDGRPMADWYPGDDVVDIISVDMYGARYGSANPTEAELLTFVKTGAANCLATLKTFCEAHSKPYAFPEWAMVYWQKPSALTTRGSGDHVSYIDAIFDFIAANNGTTNPAVFCAYQSYFNRPDGGVEVSLDGDPGGTGSHLAAPLSYAQYRARNRTLRPDLIA